jgi:hypothetical protein
MSKDTTNPAAKAILLEKELMEDVIRDAVQTFETRTGFHVALVHIERISVGDTHPLLGELKTEVRL